MTKPLEQRFWEKVDKNGPVPEHAPSLGPCWLWTGAITSAGYGSIYWKREHGKNVTKQSHVYSFELENGRYVNGLMDHQCRVRACVNPDHLKETSHLENLQNRGVRPDSKTGIRGVGFKGGKYRARLQVDGGAIFLGYFETIEEASEVVLNARRNLMPNSIGDKEKDK